ncbi:FlgO family outer membrane protein [uncultured Shewanella sp.]|uniref:FlgO family outer membrane protein n=1 Tax=uncultured Shewanella sp. TaxID=173975 RepID=UPI00261181BC|nr:FlgO family outer membrane protein [uncultured Shewanella sp.]
MLKLYKASSQDGQSLLKRLLSLSLLAIAFMFAGCSIHEDKAYVDHIPTDMIQTSKTQSRTLETSDFQAFTAKTASLLDELVAFNQGLAETQLIVVATPVLLSELTKTNAVGLVLQSSLMTGLQQRAFTVIDANMSPKLKVTPTGDFMLSRDWKQLSSSLMVDHALVSTMSVTPKGLILNTRLLNIASGRLTSSAQAFFRYDELAGFMTPPKQTFLQQEMPKAVWQEVEQAHSISMNDVTKKSNVLNQEGISNKAIEYF